VLVVAAAVVVPIVLTNSGGTQGAADRPAAGTRSAQPAMRSWQVTAEDTPAFEHGFGLQVHGDDVLAATDSALTAYVRVTGRREWTVTPPGQDTAFCGVSRQIVDDMVAVAFGAEQETGVLCRSVGLLNLRNHQLAWVRQLPPAELAGLDSSGQSLVIAGGYVYVGAQTTIVRFTVANGTEQALGKGFASGDTPCYVEDMTADTSRVYVLGGCVDLADSSYDVVLALDPATGKLLASNAIKAADARLPAGSGSDGGLTGGSAFVSVSPLVVVLFSERGGSSFYSAFARLDSALKVSWSDPQAVGARGGVAALPVSTSDEDAHHSDDRAFVADGQLFAVTTFRDQATPLANKVVAYDVDTGERRWATSVPGYSMTYPAGVDDGTLFVAGAAIPAADENDPPAVLARLDTASGRLLDTRTEPLRISGAVSGVTLAGDGAMDSVSCVVADGRLYGQYANRPLTAGQPVVFSVG
jgi:outer membrane protein assembly factor BamB